MGMVVLYDLKFVGNFVRLFIEPTSVFYNINSFSIQFKTPKFRALICIDLCFKIILLIFMSCPSEFMILAKINNKNPIYFTNKPSVFSCKVFIILFEQSLHKFL